MARSRCVLTVLVLVLAVSVPFVSARKQPSCPRATKPDGTCCDCTGNEHCGEGETCSEYVCHTPSPPPTCPRATKPDGTCCDCTGNEHCGDGETCSEYVCHTPSPPPNTCKGKKPVMNDKGDCVECIDNQSCTKGKKTMCDTGKYECVKPDEDKAKQACQNTINQTAQQTNSGGNGGAGGSGGSGGNGKGKNAIGGDGGDANGGNGSSVQKVDVIGVNTAICTIKLANGNEIPVTVHF